METSLRRDCGTPTYRDGDRLSTPDHKSQRSRSPERTLDELKQLTDSPDLQRHDEHTSTSSITSRFNGWSGRGRENGVDFRRTKRLGCLKTDGNGPALRRHNPPCAHASSFEVNSMLVGHEAHRYIKRVFRRPEKSSASLRSICSGHGNTSSPPPTRLCPRSPSRQLSPPSKRLAKEPQVRFRTSARVICWYDANTKTNAGYAASLGKLQSRRSFLYLRHRTRLRARRS